MEVESVANVSAESAEEGPQRKRGSAGKLLLRIGLLAVAIVLTGLLIGQYDSRAADDNYLAAVLEK
ncbi:MAG: hypothetical protein ABI681_01330, partial [Gemmatimonadales bacterium]